MTNSFFSKIEKLLDHDDHFDAFNFAANPQFQIEEQHEHLEKIFFAEGEKQWDLFFSRLTAFFEVGFFIEGNNIKQMFYYGQNIDKKLPKIHFKLPNAALFNILKTRASLFLRKINFSHLPDAQKMVCLLIRVESNKYIVLMTKQAEPWLQLRCESLRTAITNHDYFE